MKTKNKRVPLSMKRLHSLAVKFCREKKEFNFLQEIEDYLKYVNQHKNDIL